MPGRWSGVTSCFPTIWFVRRRRFVVRGLLLALAALTAVGCTPGTGTVTATPPSAPRQPSSPRPSATPVSVTPVRTVSPITAFRQVAERAVATPNLITSIAVARDAGFVVTGHIDNTIRIWDGRTLEAVDVYSGLPGIPWGLAIGNDDRTVVFTTRTSLRDYPPRRLLVIDLASRSILEIDREPHAAAISVAMASQAPLVAVVGDRQLDVIDVDRRETVATLRTTDTGAEVAVNATGERFLLNTGGASGGRVLLATLRGGELEVVGTGRGGSMFGSATAFSPSNDRLAFGYAVRGTDLSPVLGDLNVADVQCYRSNAWFQGANAARFSHDARLIVHLISIGGGGSTNLLDVRDASTGRSLWCAYLPVPADAPPGQYAMRLGGFAGAASEHLFFAYDRELRRVTFEVQ